MNPRSETPVDAHASQTPTDEEDGWEPIPGGHTSAQRRIQIARDLLDRMAEGDDVRLTDIRGVLEGVVPEGLLAPRRKTFVLQRDFDETGVSGTGEVAEGVRFGDGTVALRWAGPRGSMVFWQSMQDVRAIHGHNGRTRVVWDG